LILTVFTARKIRGRPIVTGQEELLGLPGTVISIDAKTAYAHVRGENWRVMSDTPLSLGQTIRVQAVNGLTLKVIPVTDSGVTQAIRPKRS
jgi:membrane-bound serine protease (ClpP class)